MRPLPTLLSLPPLLLGIYLLLPTALPENRAHFRPVFTLLATALLFTALALLIYALLPKKPRDPH